jgi:hypothetical protein
MTEKSVVLQDKVEFLTQENSSLLAGKRGKKKF